jgi:damage-control phosphatase, subfamily I
MHTHLDCLPCFLRQSLEAARSVTSDVEMHERIVKEVLRMAADLDLHRPPPILAQAIHRRLRALVGGQDPYLAAKRRSNHLALAALPELRKTVRAATDPLRTAARLAVAANAIDMGVSANLTEAEVLSALRGLPGDEPHGDWAKFLSASARAKDILYLADNAGEIAVDRLAIEVLGPERVTLAVRGAPILNDATMDDAKQVGLHEIVPVIDNGSDAPGTLIDDCSAAFRQRFERADLIISKGQGNFESLSGTRDNIAFWFKVKCPVVAGPLGLPLGTHALLPPAA